MSSNSNKFILKSIPAITGNGQAGGWILEMTAAAGDGPDAIAARGLRVNAATRL